jgi:hypothetical protein
LQALGWGELDREEKERMLALMLARHEEAQARTR